MATLRLWSPSNCCRISLCLLKPFLHLINSILRDIKDDGNVRAGETNLCGMADALIPICFDIGSCKLFELLGNFVAHCLLSSQRAQ